MHGMQQSSLPKLSSAIQRTPGSAIRAIYAEASTIPGCIRLEAGQPNFPTPAHVCAAAERAIQEGWHGYTAMQGLPSLRERLAGKLARVNGIETDADHIIVGNGGAGVVGAAVFCICDEGDEVLVPDPHWPNYRTMVSLAHGREVFYDCPAELGYQPDLDRLESLITPRTRVLIVNSPNNPTGAVYAPETLRVMADIAARHGLWIVSDECYDQIVLEGPAVAPSMAGHADPERTLSVFTFSKSYAMTGWRVGYGTGPRQLIQAMAKAVEATTSCVSTVGQKAAEAAIDGPQECIGEMVSAYRRRRDLVADLLREPELLRAVPRGAFYAMVDITPSGMDSQSFCMRLLRESHVAVAPGGGFGEGGEGTVRVSLASSDEDLVEGVGRLAGMVARAR